MSDQPNAVKDAQRLKETLTDIKTKDGMKPFVGKDNALRLFRRDHPAPSGRIHTTMLQAEPPIFKAEVWIDDVMVSSAHANPDGRTTTFRQVESAAIRRALDIAGYNAKTVIERIAESIGVEEMKKLLGSGGGERRMGGEPGQKQSEPPAQRPPVTTPPTPANKPVYGQPTGKTFWIPIDQKMRDQLVGEIGKVYPDFAPKDRFDMVNTMMHAEPNPFVGCLNLEDAVETVAEKLRQKRDAVIAEDRAKRSQQSSTTSNPAK